MPLKLKIEKEEDVPEALKDEYVKGADGVFVLQVEGAVSINDLDNVKKALQSERVIRAEKEKALKAFGENKPEDVAAKLIELEELRVKVAAGGGDTKKVEEAIAEFKKNKQLELDTIKTAYETEKAQLTASLQGALGELTSTKLTQCITSAASDLAAPGALELILAKANGEFEFDADKKEFVTKELRLTAVEWVKNFVTKFPMLAAPNTSGKANSPNGKATGPNPFMKGTPEHNVTAQMKMLKEDPKRASELRALADKANADAAAKAKVSPTFGLPRMQTL